ncbi:MAG: beta-ketoacyl synthase N-terminal-like domain-containing protein [Dehalococcoidia bacterium]
MSVVITGRGVVSPLGNARPAFAAALRAGTQPCAAPFPGGSDNDPPLLHLAPALEGADPRDEPLTSFVTAAVREALAEAGIVAGEAPLDDVGLIMNTALGPSGAVESYLERLAERGPRAARPAQFVDTLLSMPASRVGIALKLRGCTGVVGGSSAFEIALDWVRSGRERTVVAGGADCLSPKCLRHHRALVRRSGAPRALPAQGASFVVLESAERAAERGVRPLAELLGAGVVSQPQEVSVPWSSDDTGAAFHSTMRAALADAGLEAADVGAVALAAGDDASERGELAAVRDVLGEAPTVLRPKRLFGEALAGSAGLALLAALEQVAPGNTALVNAFELGGTVSSLAFQARAP